MSFWSRLFGDESDDGLGGDHAVTVYFPFSEPNLKRVFELEDKLTKAINRARVGEFDGNCVGQGECILYMYGPNADKLFCAVESVLRRSPVAEGGYAIKRYGPVDDDAREVRVEL